MRGSSSPPPRLARRALWATLVFAGAPTALGAGCRQYACNGEPFARRPGTPIIERIDITQPLTPPMPANPWHIALNIHFTDAGGDLGSGLAFVHLYGSPQVSRSFALDTFFRTSELPLDATQGIFALAMTLPQGAFPDATVVQMDVQLEDASRPDPDGLFSNCYRMNLDFAVTPIEQASARIAEVFGELAAPWRDTTR